MKKSKQYKVFAYAGKVSGMKDIVLHTIARIATQKEH